MIHKREEIVPTGITLQIPWERFTARGFGVALIAVTCLLYLMSLTQCSPPVLHERTEIRSIPLMELRWGNGDGTGNSGGNLTKSGIKKQGQKPSLDIEDASSSVKTKVKSTSTDIASSTNIKPVKDLGGVAQTPNAQSGVKDIGAGKEGLLTGTGLGQTSDGTGSGEGWGLQWGGGGNRSVLYKRLPTYPAGATATQIRVRFRVTPEGTVGQMNFVTKGDPQLEYEVTKALKMWKFNKINDEREMEGIITFSFRAN
ncbi:MAG TPA: hypothetical protein PLW09_01400 [Candidatus Kapabacteria bacterium]|nr:hypothetical protein [Candidatus Kapabacteria bacterium]